jgi:acyl carrier protein
MAAMTDIAADPRRDEALAVVRRLARAVAPEVDVDAADPDAPLDQSLDLDSIGFLHLVEELYTETAIDVPEHDFPMLETLDGLVSYIARGLPGGSGPSTC